MLAFFTIVTATLLQQEARSLDLKERPVSKVINLLKEMQSQLMKEKVFTLGQVDGYAATETLGKLLAFLLVFRSKLSYDRYWEGRNLCTKMKTGATELSRKVPILVWGDDDEACPYANGERIASEEGLLGGRVELFRVAGGRHMAFLERAQEVNEKIGEFLTYHQRKFG